MASVQEVTYRIKGDGASVQKMYKDAENAGLSFEKVHDKVGKQGSMFGSMVGANLATSALSMAGGAIKQFVSDGIEGYKNFEQFGVALTTMFHGNKEEAKQLSDELVTFAKTTPYELTEVQNATKQLIAFGSTSQGVSKELRMLGDVGSGIGSSLGDLSYLYGTVRTQGRAMTMDINQFANRGIPIWKELEKITGKNGLSLRKFVEEGKVGFPIIQRVFENLTKEGGQFNNMMSAQSDTLAGKLSNLSDAYAQFSLHMMESKGGLLKDLTTWASNFLSTLDQAQIITNKLTENRQKSGTNNQNWFERNFEGSFGGRKTTQNMESMQIQASAIEDAFKKSLSSKNLAGANRLSKEVDDLLEADRKSLGIGVYKGMGIHPGANDKRGFNKEEVSAEYAMLVSVNKTMAGSLRNYNKKGVSEKDSGLGINTDKTMGSGTTIEARAPRNQYINIAKFIETLTIESIDGNMPKQQIKDQIGNAFLEMLNDAQLSNRQ